MDPDLATVLGRSRHLFFFICIFSASNSNDFFRKGCSLISRKPNLWVEQKAIKQWKTLSKILTRHSVNQSIATEKFDQVRQLVK